MPEDIICTIPGGLECDLLVPVIEGAFHDQRLVGFVASEG